MNTSDSKMSIVRIYYYDFTVSLFLVENNLIFARTLIGSTSPELQVAFLKAAKHLELPLLKFPTIWQGFSTFKIIA